MTTELERKLRTLTLDACQQCSQFGYTPTKFKGMIADKGVVQAIKEVIGSQQLPEGFTRLWENDRLDLSAEAIVLARSEFHPLFTSTELDIARKRLIDYKHKLKIIS